MLVSLVILSFNRRMETFPSMTLVAGEMMMTQLKKVKIRKHLRKAKTKIAKEEMKRGSIQNLVHDPVHQHTNVQETTIQILGMCVCIILIILTVDLCMSWLSG
jgi:hypothetical protein